MNQKETKQQDDALSADVKSAEDSVEKQAQKALKEIVEFVDKSNAKNKKEITERNERPCTVCGHKEFVMKYRNVQGHVEGKTTGSFWLFGGSIHGYVKGETETLPVLSCRNCENERIIELHNPISRYDFLEQQFPRVYRYSKIYDPASKWLQSKGLAVARLLAKRVYLDEYQDITQMTRAELHKVGLLPDYNGEEDSKHNIDVAAVFKYVSIVIGVIVFITLLIEILTS